jgi:hypothetical protein
MKNRTLLAFLAILLLVTSPNLYSQRHTISGRIFEARTLETIPGVNIFLRGTQIGTTTNNYGYYSFSPHEDSVTIMYSFIGYEPVIMELYHDRDTVIDIHLQPIKLDAFVVTAEGNTPVSQENRMSVVTVPIRQIQEIPALLGEKDVFKVLQLMPGVQSGGEGNSGLYVRGGGPDQNLIILDDALVYNAFHLFGFFSVFNGDALKSVELTKGGFPARYGGRLSSVVEMTMKDGNRKEFKGETGIGLISSRLMLEGPIIKDKASFIVSGRRTYLDILARPLIPKGITVGYYFYDLNAKVNYEIDPRNRVYVSGYFGRDKFGIGEKTSFDEFKMGLYWQNATATARWNHVFNPRIFTNTSLIYSNYMLKIFMEEHFNKELLFDMSYVSDIEDFSIKSDWEYRPSPTHLIRYGAIVTHHTFRPSAVVLKDNYINHFEHTVTSIPSIESGVYVEDEMRIGDKLKANAGIRISHFNSDKKHYINPEPRLMVSYMLKDDLSVKGSYASMSQYVHLVSSTGVSLPTDLWLPSTDNIKPQRSQQVALGLAKDILPLGLNLSLEGYYKHSTNVLGYKDGASFMLLNIEDEPGGDFNWEESVTQGQGWSYGMEFFVQRRFGRFSGWLGYTLSWTQLQFDEVNNGEKFFARYDRRHDVSLVGVYQINQSLTLSGTWVYGTGSALTMPSAIYPVYVHYPQFEQSHMPYMVTSYGGKNQFRMEAYHRADIGLQYKKQLERVERIWEFSLYNLYNRKNPYFYYLSTEYYGTDVSQSETVLKRVSIFPLIPSISLNLKF